MEAVASGQKVQDVQHLGIMEGGKIEIHYKPVISFDDATVFEIEVK